MVVLVLVVALAALAVLGPIVGWHVNVVLTGSMEPAVHAGSLIITRPVAPDAIAVGDIIIFKSVVGETFTAHRVVGITKEPELRFITKGDANNGSDPNPVAPGQVAGLLFLQIPYLFYIFALVRTPLGLVLMIAIPAAILIVYWLKRGRTRSGES
ncbi:MAG: signal peptidase I [Methanospirillum sp.]